MPGLGLGSDFVRAFTNTLADKDGNHYVSIGEAAEYAKIENTYTFPEETPQISDPNSLGSSSYLIELKLE